MRKTGVSEHLGQILVKFLCRHSEVDSEVQMIQASREFFDENHKRCFEKSSLFRKKQPDVRIAFLVRKCYDSLTSELQLHFPCELSWEWQIFHWHPYDAELTLTQIEVHDATFLGHTTIKNKKCEFFRKNLEQSHKNLPQKVLLITCISRVARRHHCFWIDFFLQKFYTHILFCQVAWLCATKRKMETRLLENFQWYKI